MSLIKWRKDGGMFPSFPSLTGMVDNFFRDDDDFFNQWRSGKGTLPAVNINETKDAFNVEVAAPGMEKKDFKVEVENGVLCISAETKEEKEEKDDKYTRKEFSYSSFKRSFWLPDNVDADAVKANYKDGILKISLPKTEVEETAPAKVIEIS